MRVWDVFLTEQDKQHLAASPAKGSYGFGRRAAVLSIDNYRKVIGDEPEPILESIEKWPYSTGLAGWEALTHVQELFAAARAADVPVIHATGLTGEESGLDGIDTRVDDAPTSEPTAEELDRRRRRMDFVEQAAPLEGEVVLKKTGPSAFFGTPLASHLLGQGIDTVIVCGESTSGCVRATVVDGCSLRLHMIVVEEAVYDRHEASHAVNLFDMDQKYGDVVSIAEVRRWLSANPGGTARD